MQDFEIIASRAGPDQLHLTAAINADGDSSSTAADVYSQLSSILDTHGMQILHERVFGNMDFYNRFTRIREQCGDFASNPFSYIQGIPCAGRGLAGVQIHAVRYTSDDCCRIIYHNNVPCGREWKSGNATYTYLAGVTGPGPGTDHRETQASRMFDSINRILASQSLSFHHIARLWIYLADILEWYDAFNAVRTEKYKEFDLIPRGVGNTEMDSIRLPASTGINGRNPAGTAAISDVLAVSGDVQVSVLPGVQQPSAYRYGSAFSRGVCVQDAACRQIFVSGTAAIDEQGKSLYPRKVESQILKTIEIVEKLIGQKEAKLEHIRSATVYLKRPEDLCIYQNVAAGFGLDNLPAVCVAADICREELLFEMDALAVVD